MKKLLTIMTAFVLALAVAMPVMAADTQYATVEDCTKSDSYVGTKPEPKISGEGATVTLTYDSASLRIVEKDDGQHRPAGYSWIGFTVTMPSDYTKYKLTYNNETGSEVTVDGGSFDEYVGVSPEKLKAATEAGDEYLEYKLDYEWIKDDSESVNQTILIKIKLAGVTLKDKEEKEELWNKAEYDKVLATTNKDDGETNKKPAATTSKKKDNTPGTGVENVYAIAGLVAVVTLAGAVVLNKRK